MMAGRDVLQVVDTTGAGDAFCAGFLYDYVVNHDIQSALR